MRAFAQQPSSFISYELSTLSARSLCWVLLWGTVEPFRKRVRS